MALDLGRFSQESLSQALEDMESMHKEASLETASNLYSFVNYAEHDAGLVRALSDPAYDGSSRASIVKNLFQGKIDDAALKILENMVALRWTSPEDLLTGVETVATNIALVAKENETSGLESDKTRFDTLSEIENEILSFSALSEKNSGIAQAMNASAATDEAKEELIQRLLGSADPITSLVVTQAMVHPRGLRPQVALENVIEATNNRLQRWIVRVSTPHDLSQEQQKRLQEGVSKLYNRPLKLDIFSDKSLIGGLKIQIGNEIFDGSVLGKMSDLDHQISRSV